MPSANSQPPRNPLRVAIIGYGLAGAVFHAPLVAATPGMEVAAIVTGHPERQRRAPGGFPHAAVLSTTEGLWHDPAPYDLLVVAAANRAHVPLCLAAMKLGLPVVVG